MAPRGRPATGKTPHRTVRIPDGVWDAAKAKAETEGRTITDVILTLLQRYNATPPRQ